MKSFKILFKGILCFIILLGYTYSKGFTQSIINEEPNILFISIDDLNDWTGFLGGHPGVQTPNIDKLAQRSLTFTNAYTASPACNPSRTAIMTGVHPARSGIMRNSGRWQNVEMLKDVEKLEQFFKNRGYKTLGAGKIYHTLEYQRTRRSQVEAENWDFYYPSPYINLPFQLRSPERTKTPFGRGKWWTWGAIPIEDNEMSDYQIVDWASYELNQKHNQPFFLAVGIFRPHSPWEVPQKYFDMYPLEDIQLPNHKNDDLKDAVDHGRRGMHKWVLQNDQWKNIIQAYAASITFADAMVGRLLDAFEQSTHIDNTIIILWSDHGMHIGEKENYEKFTLWEESTRVPFILNAPGLTRPGSTINQPVSLLDIYPTLAELTGFEIPTHVDGTSLVPLIKNPDGEHAPVITSYRFGDEVGVGHTVRSLHYRYIYYPDIGLEELYDHRKDPNEWDNIAYKKEYRDVIERHRQSLLGFISNLKWNNNAPLGYEFTENELILKSDFKSILN